MILGVLGVVALAGAWAGWQAWQAADALTEARAAAGRMEADLRSGVAPSMSDLGAAQRATGRAKAATSDPVYTMVSHLPWVGRQLVAVATVSEALDDVTTRVMPPLVDLVTAVDDGSLRTPDGRIDLDLVAAASPDLRAADEAMAAARERVAALRTDGLLSRLATAVHEADDALGAVAETVHQARTVADLAPGMLGAEGPRTYLVLALNNAELRPGGGIVGSVAAMTVDEGRLTLGEQVAASSLKGLEEPVLPLSDEELAADTDGMGRYLQNATLTPDFPRTAELVVARWHEEVGGDVDGVVALDPVAVATMLKAVGPVTTEDGATLDGATFVSAIMSQPYLGTVDPEALDHMFAEVAASVFRGFLSSDLDGAQLLSTMRTVVSEQRLKIWSARPYEQQALSATTVGGAFLAGPFAGSSGVFLTDATGGKLDYYLTVTTSVSDLVCTGTGGTARLSLTLTYEPPVDVATSSVFLRGHDHPYLAPGDNALLVSFYPAVGGAVGSVTQDGQALGGQQVVRSGRTGVRVPVTLAPGQTTTLRADVPVRDGQAAVWTTPTVTSGGIVVDRCP